VSNINFAIWIFLGVLYISHEKLPKDGKVISHVGFKSNVLPGPLTDLRVWVGFCNSSPQQGVKYQLWYLDYGGRNPIYIPWKCQRTALGIISKVLHAPSTDLSAWVGDFVIWIFGGWTL